MRENLINTVLSLIIRLQLKILILRKHNLGNNGIFETSIFSNTRHLEG